MYSWGAGYRPSPDLSPAKAGRLVRRIAVVKSVPGFASQGSGEVFQGAVAVQRCADSVPTVLGQPCGIGFSI